MTLLSLYKFASFKNLTIAGAPLTSKQSLVVHGAGMHMKALKKKRNIGCKDLEIYYISKPKKYIYISMSGVGLGFVFFKIFLQILAALQTNTDFLNLS